MRLGKINRYYNGVTKGRTTICCSAVALTIALVASLRGQSAPPLPTQTPTPTPIQPPVAPQTPATPQGPPKPPAIPPFRVTTTVPFDGSLAAVPAYNQTRGFFPMDDGHLIARDLTDGHVIWTIEARTALTPATSSDMIFTLETTDVVARRQEDGVQVWRIPFAESHTPLVWDNSWLVATITSGAVVAIRASDGGVIWRHEVESEVRARPVMAADRVYVAGSDRIIALQVETGERLWERRLGGPPNEMLALDDRIYVGSDDNFLYCLLAKDGVIDWRWRTGGDVIGVPLADDGRVYFVSRDNVLRALDRRSGAQRWKRPLPLRPTVGPARTQDFLIVSGVTPSVRLFQMKDGVAAGDVSTDGDLASAPYVLPKVDPPTFVAVTRNIAKGEMLTVISRVSPPAPTEAPPAPAPPPGAGTK
jgi:putative pyrroloquinoline-quinone binding quinoprotein/putative pyrroloquinoline-quinone-binding quinoprotein